MLAAAATVLALVSTATAYASVGPGEIGEFSSPFTEPGPDCPHGAPLSETEGKITCKPTAVNIVALPNGKLLYWDGLEAEEDVKLSIVAELGDKAVNDQSRLLDLSGPSWSQPAPVDGGANGSANTEYLVPNAPGPLEEILNDPGGAAGALFCSDQVILPDGRVLTPGGTHYYSEPHLPESDLGLAELEGLRNTRIYNPSTNTWTESGQMNYGRWYPSLVTLGDGSIFVASGVTKLVKPVYPERLLDSGTNVRQTETYDVASGKWTANGEGASRSLPLYPRLHLLPDGKVYYDAAGQAFNPFGEAYDEATWIFAAAYDPASKSWRSLGVPLGISAELGSLNVSPTLGFRGSSFSIMLPLKPPYTRAQFLSSGGVLGTTPGSYLPTSASEINTVDTAHGDAFSSTATGPLTQPRWFSTAVLLPTGKVMTFSGASADEVVAPGTGFPIKQAEQFDPETAKWTSMATAHEARTYHNTAILLPSGQVLLGGHAPISALDTFNFTIPGGFTENFRNPSFEVYNPPYMSWGAQPTISSVSANFGRGSDVTVATPQANEIASVMLVRNTALTHLVDGDQRTVELPITSRSGGSLQVFVPSAPAVLPPGPYMLFINKRTAKGLQPSAARQLTLH
ncbi:MAG TPA: galactose oxidase-like domain-containing protein [Solirubrobacteraceae bacterium]|nr:galactose oxidase-like domain-containing protein [Solirubrobacteraceae bacterium]